MVIGPKWNCLKPTRIKPVSVRRSFTTSVCPKPPCLPVSGWEIHRIEVSVLPSGFPRVELPNKSIVSRCGSILTQPCWSKLAPGSIVYVSSLSSRKRWHWDAEQEERTVTPGAQLYMWLTYTVLANDGAWPMPLLAEKANVYWDQSSLRTVNGDALDGQAEPWLPNSVAAVNPLESSAHQVNFPSGETVILLPVSDAQDNEIPADLQLAVVLDRSRSMEMQAAAVDETLTALQTMVSDVDVYLTSSFYRGEQPSVAKLAKIVPNQIDYIGGQNAAELLDQFFALSEDRGYDAIFVLTDGTGFKVGGESLDLPIPNAPVWMVHLDGNLPYGYDDATLQAVQSQWRRGCRKFG